MRAFKAATVGFCMSMAVGLFQPASAGAVFTYQSYGLSGSSNLHITDTALGIDNEYGAAGLITLNGSSILQGFCVDIATWLTSSGDVSQGVNPLTNQNMTGSSNLTASTKLAAIGALIGNGTNYAAVQLGIWEVEYGSAATFRPDDASLQNITNGYFASIKDGQWTTPTGEYVNLLTAAYGESNQTIAYLSTQPGGTTTGVAVTEPTALALFAGSLAMLGGLRRFTTRHRNTDRPPAMKSSMPTMPGRLSRTVAAILVHIQQWRPSEGTWINAHVGSRGLAVPLRVPHSLKSPSAWLPGIGLQS